MYAAQKTLQGLRMKVLIVGSGAQGKAMARYLIDVEEVEKIKLSDKEPDSFKGFLDRIETDKISRHKVDANDVEQVASLAEDVDILVNAVPTSFNLDLMDAALQSASHYQDLAFATNYNLEKDNFERELEKTQMFRDKGLTALTGTGSSPGIVNVLVARAADKLEELKEIMVYLGEKRESEEHYSTWWPEGLLYDCLQEPKVYKDGEFVKEPPFSGKEKFNFPEPVGLQTVWSHCHEETMMFPRTIGSETLNNVNVKMAGLDFLENLYQYGYLDQEKMEIGSCEIAPADVYLELTPSVITPEELERKIEEGVIGKSCGIIAIKVRGKKDKSETEYTYFCISPDIRKVHKEWPGISDESFTTAFSAAIMTRLLGTEIEKNGVITPEELTKDVRKKFLQELLSLEPPIKIIEKKESSIKK